jgi:hypothetical protein
MPVHSWDEAHWKLGHISLTSMKALLIDNSISGLLVDTSVEPTIHCEACIQSKIAHTPFPKQATHCADQPSNLIHTALWGPSQTALPSSSKYYISMMDDHTCLITVKFLKKKDDTEQAVCNYTMWIETQLGWTPKAFRANNGGEYIGMCPWLETKGIELHLLALYSQSQNGVSERANCTLLEIANAMCFEKNLPATLFVEAINHTVYI